MLFEHRCGTLSIFERRCAWHDVDGSLRRFDPDLPFDGDRTNRNRVESWPVGTDWHRRTARDPSRFAAAGSEAPAGLRPASPTYLRHPHRGMLRTTSCGAPKTINSRCVSALGSIPSVCRVTGIMAPHRTKTGRRPRGAGTVIVCRSVEVASVVEVEPAARMLRQVNLPVRCSLLKNGRHQNVGPQHEAVLHFESGTVIGEIVEQRTHDRLVQHARPATSACRGKASTGSAVSWPREPEE